ncbi:Translation initiation factor 3 subunit c [Podochytrium sp. JEL0797]|nr:Translation initiation factor 3 subunit c [Podochytrium sp. JEL0797]
MSRFLRKKTALATSDSDSHSDSNSDSDASGGMFASQRKGNNAAMSSDDSSDSSSDSDSSNSDSDAPRKQQTQRKGKAPLGVQAFVPPPRDARLNDLRQSIRLLTNAKKINDWVAINNEFDRLQNNYNRVSQIQPDDLSPAPLRCYHRTIAQLDDAIKLAPPKMNAVNSKAFTQMKSKLKKVVKALEVPIAAWRENPLDEEQSEEEFVTLARKAATSIPAAAPAAVDDAEESDDSIFGNDSDSESDDESEIDEEEIKNMSARERMLKKFGRTPEKDSDDEADAKKKPIVRKQKVEKPKPTAAAAADDTAAPAEDGFKTIGKGGKVQEVTPENLYKRLQELILARGKKSTDKVQQIENLRKLLAVASTAHMKLQVLLVLIPSLFDHNPASGGGYLPAEYWKITRANIDLLLELLESNHSISVVETVANDDLEPAQSENLFKEGKPVELRGNIYSFIDRLSDEFIKSLQHIDPHTTEYIERLKDETPLYVLIVRAQGHFARVKAAESLDACILKRVMHIYYKTDNIIAFMENALPNPSPNPSTLVHTFCTTLYQTTDIRIRARALLAHVYHLALHGSFYEARDMLLMSHLQEQASNTDIDTQILYNRTVVQLGMSAFRAGLIRESAAALQDFFGSGKTKELLAQGFQAVQQNRNVAGGVAVEKTVEQERLEKQRLLPFHMHMNLELLECVYLTCSMLLEIPNMALFAHDSRRKMISKPFRRNLEYNQKQVFIGPPENTRDHIMSAAKSLSSGDWEKSLHQIHAIKIWHLMPTYETQIKPMLTLKLQHAALRTYVFQFSRHYDSLSIETLAGMFDLSVEAVHGELAGMIVAEELVGARLDEPTRCVVLKRGEVSRLEFLAGVYAEKVGVLVDGNEKLLESRVGGLGLQQALQQLQKGGEAGKKGGSVGGVGVGGRRGNKVGFN